MKQLSIVLLFVAVVGCGVEMGRDAARRSVCKNNMKQIGFALHNYHSTYDSFPPAFIADENGKPMHSWRVLILPYLEQQALYDQYDFSQPWDSAANRHVLDNMPQVYGCPSSSASGQTTTNYAGVLGPRAAFRGAELVRKEDFTDGPSRTIMVGEVEGSNIPWTKPQDIDIEKQTGLSDPAGFHSKHAGGAHFMFGDASVRFIGDDIGKQLLQELSTLDGGEDVGDF